MDDIKAFNYLLDILLLFSTFFFIGSLFIFPLVFDSFTGFICFLSGYWSYFGVEETGAGSLADFGFPSFITPFLIIGSIGVSLFCWMIHIINFETFRGDKKKRILLTRIFRILLTITSLLGFVGIFYFRKNFLPLIMGDPFLKFTGGLYIALILFPLFTLIGVISSITLPSYSKLRENLSPLHAYAEQIVHDERIADFEKLFLNDFKTHISHADTNHEDMLHLFWYVIDEIIIADEIANPYEDMALPFAIMFPGIINDIQKELKTVRNKNKIIIAEKLLKAIITHSIIDDS